MFSFPVLHFCALFTIITVTIVIIICILFSVRVVAVNQSRQHKFKEYSQSSKNRHGTFFVYHLQVVPLFGVEHRPMLFLRLEKEVEKIDVEAEERSFRAPGLGGRTGVPPLELGPDPGPELRNMLCDRAGMRPPLVLLTSLL